MGDNLKNSSCETGKAAPEQPELDSETPEVAVKNVQNGNAEEPKIKSVDVGNSQPTPPAAKDELAEKSDGQEGNVSPRKDNTDFEPEFDGDLEHVSWLSMKPFGDKKGF